MRSHHPKPVILITSAGSLVGAAILRCLEPIRDALTIVGTNSVAGPIAFFCDRLYRVPPTTATPAFIAAVQEIIGRERPDLVLAGRDEDVAPLSVLAAVVRLPAARMPVPPPELAPVFTDKLQAWRFAGRHGLPFAPTAEGAGQVLELARRHGFPLVAKPRNGAGSRDVFLLSDKAGLEGPLADPRLMVQAFLSPQDLDGQWEAYRDAGAIGMPWHWNFADVETTAELVVAADGAIQALCIDAGATAPPLRTGVHLLSDPQVAAVGRAWGEALSACGHRGPVNIQGKRLADGSFVPYEVGARFGGTSISRAMLGRNLVLRLVAEAVGLPEPEAVRREGKIGLSPRRLTLPGAWFDQFDTEGRWQAPRGWPPDTLFAGTPDGAGSDDRDYREIWHDRAALAAWAGSGGLPFVRTAVSIAQAAELVRSDGFPLIAKPRRGEGMERLLECWEEVKAAFDALDIVMQPCIGADDLARDRSAWRNRPGAPWHWRVSDTVEVVEAVIDRSGSDDAVRVATCVQRGSGPFEIRAITAPDIIDAYRLWADRLDRAGYRGALRLTGKRDGQGNWLPFSASPRLIRLPGNGLRETRFQVPD